MGYVTQEKVTADEKLSIQNKMKRAAEGRKEFWMRVARNSGNAET
jgi:hypothetical protein